MTLDEAIEFLEFNGYRVDEGLLSRTLATGALAAGLAFGNSGIKSKPVVDNSFGKGNTVHLQQRYNYDSDRFGVPTSYKLSKNDTKNVYTEEQEIELTKKKILATPDTMLKQYGKENTTSIAKLMVKTANKYNVDVDILLAIAGTESNFDIAAKSDKGAVGMMQITRTAAYDSHHRLQSKPDSTFNFDEFKKLKSSIDNAGRIVADLSKRRENVIEMIFASYNGGTKQATGWRAYTAKSKYDKNGNIAPKLTVETKNYVIRCMQLYKIYKKIQSDYKPIKKKKG